MRRLIDTPGVQIPVQTIVDRPVLTELLALASSAAATPAERERYWQWHEEVECGERGSLTVGEWRDTSR